MVSASLILVISVFIASCQAQIPSPMPCRKMPEIPNFDPLMILGRWYRYAAYQDCAPSGICQETVFSDYHHGKLRVHQIQYRPVSNKPGALIKESLLYVLTHLYNSSFAVGGPPHNPYYDQINTFWNTDYESYIIKGICRNINDASSVMVWILTKDPHPSASLIAKINQLLKEDELPSQYLVFANQTNCPNN